MVAKFQGIIQMADPVTLTDVGSSYTLAAGDTIADATVPAQITVSALNTTLTINGTVTGTTQGILVNQNASSNIIVGATGIITGTRAIQLSGGALLSAISEVTITNAGQIRTTNTSSSATAINTGFFSSGRITNLTNEATGLIQGVSGFVNNITNAGTINGGRSNALLITGNVTIENTGTINATPTAGSSLFFATNTIQVSAASGGTSLLQLTNSGTIVAPTAGPLGRAIQASSAIITNSTGGTIDAIVDTQTAILAQIDLNLNNQSLIRGQIQGGDSATIGDSITNTGTITGAVFLRAGNDTLINRGALNGVVDLGAGDDVFDGVGGTLLAQVIGGLGNDTFIVSQATIGSGTTASVQELLGEGTDTVISTVNYTLGNNIENLTLREDGGAIDGTGNALNNVLTGNGFSNVLTGGDGVDSLSGGAGDDRLILGTGAAGSSIDGGADTDTLVVNSTLTSLAGLISIEALELAGAANLTLTGNQFANGLAFTTALSGTGSITVNMDAGINFLSQGFAFTGSSVTMTVNGTSGTDIIKCGTGVHTINAGDGVDQIRGGTAADIINGGDGNDKIIGFTGADIITGGAGSDQFRYFFQGDSGIGGNADQLTDFAIGIDRLNFALIDADAATADDQAFAFIGTAAFTNTGVGQIRYTNSGADLLVQADVNGDGVADMEIILQGLNGGTLTAADFIL
jgi:hypothetical protein